MAKGSGVRKSQLWGRYAVSSRGLQGPITSSLPSSGSGEGRGGVESGGGKSGGANPSRGWDMQTVEEKKENLLRQAGGRSDSRKDFFQGLLGTKD